MTDKDSTPKGSSLVDVCIEFNKEKIRRTMNLRRQIHPTIATAMSIPSNPTIVTVDSAVAPLLTPEIFSKTVLSNIESTVIDYLIMLTKLFNGNQNLLQEILFSDHFPPTIGKFLHTFSSEKSLIYVLNFLGLVFPNCGENKNRLIDEELIYYLTTFMKTGSLPFIDATIQLLPIILNNSVYGRDSILCYDLLDELVSLAKSDEERRLPCCSVIQQIFSIPSKIDPRTLSHSFQIVAELLDLDDTESLQHSILALTSILKRNKSLSIKLIETQKHFLIVAFLKYPELVGPVLPLIGIISFGHPPSVPSFLESGLLEVLFPLIGSEHTASVYFVLTHLTESASHLVLPSFSPEFYQLTIDIASNSPFEVKQEAVNFLASVIKLLDEDKLESFINDDLLNALSEMLNGTQPSVILRCLEAVIRFCRILNYLGKTSQIAEINTNYFAEPLENLISHSSCVVAEHAIALQNIIDGIVDPDLL